MLQTATPGAPMENPSNRMLRIGDWCVNPSSGQISRNGETARLEARTMRLLLCLAEHAGETISIDDLLSQVWAGVIVTPDSVYQAVASLRRLLGDDPKQPAYIATVPRLGYRMVANVSPWQEQPSQSKDASRAGGEKQVANASTASGSALKSGRTFVAYLLAAVAVICLAFLAAVLFRGGIGREHPSNSLALAAQPQKSIAVLPFLDLTEGMKEEEFADGMTEELIDKLSKIPGLRVPGATSSFYFKGKQVPVAEIAKTLGVAYVLDGSVRKSGSTVRIASRLVRAENGYVIWSETYDKPLNDVVMTQDEIAGAVAKALQSSMDATTR
jgi:transcriptional activator of cad operon